MGKLLGIADTDVTPSQFAFSGKKVEQLTESEYTLVDIVVDLSGSVSGFINDLQKAVSTIVQSCTKLPRADMLLIRVTSFNDSVAEIHGFLPLSDVQAWKYKMIPSGLTALFDGALSSVEALSSYAERLSKQGIRCNAVTFVITDGCENRSRIGTTAKIQAAINKAYADEYLDSLKGIIISLGSYSQAEIDRISKDMGFEQAVSLANTSPESLAKVANFVSRSISSSSQALATGGTSQNLTI